MKLRLSQSQQRAVDHDDGALLVVAGPGSGKTRVVTERIRRLLTTAGPNFRILALTFTNKAANEMAERLQDVPEITRRAFIGTMHSFCTEVLANRGKSVGVTGIPHIFESFQDRKQVLSDVVRSDSELFHELQSAGAQKEQNRRLDQWLGAIGEAKNLLQFPEMVEDGFLRRLYEAYDAGLRACGVLDFDDLLLLTYRLFETRPEITAFYRRQYRYICVDEAQDLNEAQYRILCALCGMDYFNIMMVGDPKQAIFMWNGASPQYMEHFVRDFRAKKIELNENFRSSQKVVAAAHTLDPMYSVDGQLPISGQLTVRECADEQSEAEYVVSALLGLMHTGHPDIEGEVTPERVGILGRNKFVFTALEAELVKQKVAFNKKLSATTYESESDLVEDFELALRVLSNPLDRLHLGTLSSRWGVVSDVDSLYGDRDLRSITGLQVLERLTAGAKGGHAAVTMEAIQEVQWTPQDFRFLRGLQAIERRTENVSDEERALVLQDLAQWRKHWNYFVRSEPGGKHSVASFLNQVALGTTQQPRQEGVALLTVHSAKGTEFDVVFVIGLTEGTFPDFRATGDAMREEFRNAFVAVTRSRRLLYLSYPRVRLMPWGDKRIQQPSRFISMLKPLASPIA
jgi:DNA helicase II / ATP-dependent DNA helicase PcrA